MTRHSLRDSKGRFRKKDKGIRVTDSRIITASTWIPMQDYTWSTWTGTSTGGNYLTRPIQNYTITNTYAPNQDNVWREWREMNYVQARHDQYRIATNQAPVLTPEQRQAALDAQQAERERLSRERLARQRQIEGAQDRALELLEMILTPEEKLWRAKNGGDILVRTASGRMYVIEVGSAFGVHGNVRETDEHGCRLGRICAAPKMYEAGEGAIPLADGWVGQYLYIKHQEEHFRATGNWSHRRECQHQEVPVLGQRGLQVA